MKTTYIQARDLEMKYGEIWRPRWRSGHRQHIEYLSRRKLYFGGVGGGFSVIVTQLDDQWAYLEKIYFWGKITCGAATNPDQYRIPRSEYDRLIEKAINETRGKA